MTFANFQADKVPQVIAQFYPDRLKTVTDANVLNANLSSRWQSLANLSPCECARVIISCCRRWPYFGSECFRAVMKGRREEAVIVAVNDRGVHLLNVVTLVSLQATGKTNCREILEPLSILKHHHTLQDPIATYPYNMILSFGGYHDDFMLTVNRPQANVDEPNRERLTFT